MKHLLFAIKITVKLYRRIESIFIEQLSTMMGKIYLASMGVIIGDGTKFFALPFCSIFKGSTITVGADCIFRSHYKDNAIGINHKIILRTTSRDAFIRIGNKVGMSGTSVCAHSGITIGDNVLIGSNVVISDNDMHPISPSKRMQAPTDITSKNVVIENNVWIGAGCYILKGVTIGSNSVIGACSVVTNDIPPNTIAAGIPAKAIKKVPDDE